jgi:cytochrome c heme-lyase
MWSFLGYAPPFDRHDWVIDRGVRFDTFFFSFPFFFFFFFRSVRYVIDYYDDKPPPGKVAGLYLDVRPALDSVGLAWDRMKMALKKF